MNFIIDLLDTELIADLMCYSTFHVDSEPWHQSHAVIIGDAAHAYGPLTAKMANLAINDADTLASILNVRAKGGIAQALRDWEVLQRPKFEVTRIRTLRHLQLYSPRMRAISSFFWRFLPSVAAKYFGSIFAYDYEVYGEIHEGKLSTTFRGIVGVTHADPLKAIISQWVQCMFIILLVPCFVMYFMH